MTVPTLSANPAPIVKNRLTLVEHLYFQEGLQQPTETSCQFSTTLDSEEVPYNRPSLKLTEDQWTLLDKGWITEVGLMIITNEEGRFLQLTPTPEEIEELKQHSIIISFDGISKAFEIPPQSSCRVPHPTTVYLKSGKATTKASITLYPK